MSVNLKVLCPSCGSTLTEKARRLRSASEAECPRCGTVELADEEQRTIRRALRKAKTAVEEGRTPRKRVKL